MAKAKTKKKSKAPVKKNKAKTPIKKSAKKAPVKKKTPVKKASSAAKTKATKAIKPAKKTAKAPAKKTVAPKPAATPPAPKKAAVKKPSVKKTKQIVGEGDYQASKTFLKEQSDFVKQNSDKIPALAEEAKKALEGPEGDELRAADKEAASHSKAGHEE